MNLKFHYNDGGREDAGYNGYVGDCLARAVTILLGLDYDDVCEAYYTDRKKMRVRKYWEGITREEFGLTRTSLALGPRPTLSEIYDYYGDCIVEINNHYLAIVDGVINDTFDWRWLSDNKGERKGKAVWTKDKTKGPETA